VQAQVSNVTNPHYGPADQLSSPNYGRVTPLLPAPWGRFVVGGTSHVQSAGRNTKPPSRSLPWGGGARSAARVFPGA
jgi:hypothetical protein